MYVDRSSGGACRNYDVSLGTNPYPRLSFFSGFVTKEVAFFHKDSKSLIEADLLFNLPPKEQVRSLVLPVVSWEFTTKSVLEIPKSNLPSSYWGLQSVVIRTQTTCVGRWGEQRVRSPVVTSAAPDPVTLLPGQ